MKRITKGDEVMEDPARPPPDAVRDVLATPDPPPDQLDRLDQQIPETSPHEEMQSESYHDLAITGDPADPEGDDPEDDGFDPFAEADQDESSTLVDKVLEAFPGSEVLSEDEEADQ